MVRVDIPNEPDCTPTHGHDWVSPREVVLGLSEEPGVFYHNTHTVVVQCCCHCGVYRRTTWSGEVVHVEYLPASERSLALIDKGE